MNHKDRLVFFFVCVCVEAALLVACLAKVLMIADGVCLNLLFVFPEQNMLQIGNLPYAVNDVMHRQPLCWVLSVLLE